MPTLLTEFLLNFSKSIDTPEVKDWKELFQASRKKKKDIHRSSYTQSAKTEGVGEEEINRSVQYEENNNFIYNHYWSTQLHKAKVDIVRAYDV